MTDYVVSSVPCGGISACAGSNETETRRRDRPTALAWK